MQCALEEWVRIFFSVFSRRKWRVEKSGWGQAGPNVRRLDKWTRTCWLLSNSLHNSVYTSSFPFACVFISFLFFSVFLAVPCRSLKDEEPMNEKMTKKTKTVTKIQKEKRKKAPAQTQNATKTVMSPSWMTLVKTSTQQKLEKRIGSNTSKEARKKLKKRRGQPMSFAGSKRKGKLN